MGEKKKNNHSIGSALRDRGKQVDSDITDVWLSHKIDERNKANNKKKRKQKINAEIRKIRSKITKTAKSVQSVKAKAPKNKSPKKLFKLKLKTLKGNKGLALLLVLVAAFIFWPSGSSDEPQQLGATTDNSVEQPKDNQNQPQTGSQGVETVISTEFDILWPGDKGPGDYEVARVSPPSNDPVYAYIDVFNGAELRVSQQKIPDDFQGNVAEKVKEVATSFQASDVIEVDGMNVYHGLSERFGEVQSLVFEKEGLLVLIASAKRFSDIEWAGYVSQLN